ncbi:MAG TPA: tetratricopeptide repeat protein [Saprospiraceae bacterium]|nr:tetratricopeptide repeat protein [Saprospiraceae bacterium]
MKQCLKFLTLAILIFLSTGVKAQNWKSHYRLAEKKEKVGAFSEAGFHYEAAYRLKSKRKLAYKAAESYYAVKDFRRAANMYSKILDYDKHYPLVRLKYARCLKQSGQYDQAIREFVFFISHYKGDDRSVWDAVVNKEIEGCALGISYSDAGSGLLKINHLPNTINTGAIEMAPIPVSDNTLYFTSVQNGTGTFLRSNKEENEWTQATPPNMFPKIDGQHYGSGSLSSDYRRFYFTECQNSDGLRAKCRIFVTVKQSDSWSKPTALADYINWPGSTTTQPFVTSKDGKELLFFASNREGGQGGLDIWVAEREITSSSFDFSFPKNLGPSINTLGDEQTPFYATDEEALYFSSNGLVSIGGQDVFKSHGVVGHFAQAENLGAPINSPADDMYFVKSQSGNNGYLVSNRIFGNQKISTTDEDIFSFNFSPNQYVLEGLLLDNSHQVVKNAEVALYEKNGNGELVFLTGKTSLDGAYKFPVRVNKNYVVEVQKDGFPVKEMKVNTYSHQKNPKLEVDIVLSELDEYETMMATTNETPTNTIGSSVAASDDKTAPRYTVGTTYKIQLSNSSADVDLHHTKYGRIESLGKIEKNYISARDTYWILLGDYAGYKEAVRNLAKVKNRGFEEAFIVKYRNGERVGIGK